VVSALRDAKPDLIKQFADQAPALYWAGFTLNARFKFHFGLKQQANLYRCSFFAPFCLKFQQLGANQMCCDLYLFSWKFLVEMAQPDGY